MNDTKPLVSVCCITYNHANYIRDAIEGFLMQKTTFPIEILIHDDASTDGTAEIVKGYAEKHPNLIFPIFQKENQYSKGKKPNPEFNFPRAKGKYIALCEGDDYWTDSLKLQKQIEFMEKNQNFSGCFHGSTIDYQNSFRKKNILYKGILPIDLSLYLKKDIVMTTASLLFNKNCVNDIPEWYKKLFAGDFCLKYFILLNGYMGYIDENMSVYRKGVPGSWSKQKLTCEKIDREYYDNIYALAKINQTTNYKFNSEIISKTRRLYARYVARHISICNIRNAIELYLKNIFVFTVGGYKLLIISFYSRFFK